MEAEYDQKTIRFLERVWGEGFMSPGSTSEVDLIINGLDLTAKRILDLGCGTGGVTIYLAENYALHSIVGFDVEQPSLDVANERMHQSEAKGNIKFLKGTPGILPFNELEFDIVFTKDALIHVEDKAPICNEIFRILKNGGTFACSDWLIIDSLNPSTELNSWIESEGFEFLPATIEQYTVAMEKAGLSGLSITNRNEWHKEQIEKEIKKISNTLFDKLCVEFGHEFVQQQLNAWHHLQVVANKGDLFPAHIRATKLH